MSSDFLERAFHVWYHEQTKDMKISEEHRELCKRAFMKGAHEMRPHVDPGNLRVTLSYNSRKEKHRYDQTFFFNDLQLFAMPAHLIQESVGKHARQLIDQVKAEVNEQHR